MARDILKKIKDGGHRLTRTRRAIVEILCRNKCLLTPAEILAGLRKQHLKTDRTTVYRELGFLLENNLVRKTQTEGNKIYYEIPSEHHHHLICTRCRRVQKITLPDHLKKQERKIFQTQKFQVAFHSLEFYGLCQKCALKSASAN